MKMSRTAALFLLQCILLVDISVADPLIDVSPSELSLGITSRLDINCSFSLNNHPDMAAFISLVVSRANSTGQHYEDLAAITEFSPNSVNVATQEKVDATGVHSQTGESFLHLSWQYPTALQGGIYKCSALGVGMMGHSLEMTNTSSLTLHQANIIDLFEKLKQLEIHESSMDQQIQTMTQNIQTLENDKISMEKQIADLERNNSHLEGVVVSLAGAHVDLIGSYGNKNYYVSNYAFADINEATDICRLLGGQLTVIDNEDEFTAVQGFLTAASGFQYVVIAGSDEKTEGNWVLPDSNTSLPFMSWDSGRPYIDSTRSCLWLAYSWSMVDWLCHFDPPRVDSRFMCEV